MTKITNGCYYLKHEIYIRGDAVIRATMRLNSNIKRIVCASVAAAMLLSQTTAIAAVKTSAASQKDVKYTWNLGDIYKDSSAFENDFSTLKKDLLPKIAAYKNNLNDSSSVLKCLKLNEQIGRMTEKLYVYSHMLADSNQADSKASELSSRTDTLTSDVSAATAFIQTDILKLSDDTINKMISDPDFKDYSAYLSEILRKKAHTLSESEEKLLALSTDISGSPNDIYNKVTLADMTFPTIKDSKGKDFKLTEASYGTVLENKDRNFRKRAFDGILGSFGSRKNTLAATLNAEVKKNIFYAKARGFNSALEASLYSDDVPVTVYTNLVKSVDANLSYLQKYVELRKKVLKLDKVHAYDMFVPLTKDYTMKIPYEDAVKLANKSLKPLGDDYLSKFNEGIGSRWIDVYETPNKYTGGYNWGSYDTHPYILMNYEDNLDSALTLVHEMGHALNSVYSNSTQPYTASSPTTFTAEVASTANEMLTMNYLIQNAKSDEEKLYLINQQIENIRGTMYTQVMFAEFEEAIHERVEKGEALSADTLNNMWSDLLKKYNGPNYVVDDSAKVGWARIPHFYMNFYVYKYATAISASNQLAKNIMDGKEGARDKYIEFLKAGGAEDPITELKNAGVDMNSEQPVDNLLAYFGSLVDQMEKILKSQGRI